MSNRQHNYSVAFGRDNQKRPKRLSVTIGDRLWLVSKKDRAAVLRALKREVAAWLNELE